MLTWSSNVKGLNYLSVINDNLKKRVHQQDAIGLDRRRIQQNWLGWSVETVAVQNRLYHDEGLRQIFTIEHMPTRRCIVTKRPIKDC